MRTTLDVDEELLEQVVKTTGAKSRSKAVSEALEAYLRLRRLKALKTVPGRIILENNWRELEELETDE